jgi:predicted porin
MNLELFGDANVASKVRVDKPSASPRAGEIKNNNIGFGGRYTYGEWIAYAGLRNVKSEADNNLVTGAGLVSSKTTAYGLGVGRNAKLSDSTTLNYALGYHRRLVTTQPKGGNEFKARSVIMPLNVGLESELASWFIARAGMQYNLSDRGTASGINKNTTNGALGGTFRFGKVDVDFAVSTDENLTGAAVNQDPAINGSSFGFSSHLIGYASVTYRW